MKDDVLPSIDRITALGLQFVTLRINERRAVKGSMRGDGKDERRKIPFHFPLFHELYFPLPLVSRFAQNAAFASLGS